jgi:UDPglucose 6-dehydrogenase
MKKNKKIVVFGLWHQGIVAASCLAEAGYSVVGLDLNKDVLDTLINGGLPVEEPYLLEMVEKQRELKRLKFSADIESSIIDSDYIFISYDTPVSDADISDLSIIFETANLIGSTIRENTTLIITSQLPAGTTDEIVEIINNKSKNKIKNFAYIPENLKLGQAIERFKNPALPVIGVSENKVFYDLQILMSSFSKKWEKTDILTAEMLKHALNTFLSMSVVLANELSDISEKIGANGQELGRLLKLESRIGQGALTRPGLAFAGGTLARDVVSLIDISSRYNLKSTFLKGIWESNNYRKSYIFNTISNIISPLKNKCILVLGLTYKANTSTLRRSGSIELIKKLTDEEVEIMAHDPGLSKREIKTLPKNITFISDFYQDIDRVDAVVLMTPWEIYKEIDFKKIENKVFFDTTGLFTNFDFSNYKINFKTIGMKTKKW